MKYLITICTLVFISTLQIFGEIITVETLSDLNTEIAKSDAKIRLKPGKYDLKNLSGRKKVIEFSGSNNIIDLRGVYVNVTVGLVDSSYLRITGDNNRIVGGEFEDNYQNGLKEIKDFSAYNKDKRRLARGLRGAPVMSVEGDQNTVKGIKLTVRGSFPYGYGSIYGIGRDHVFGLNKRCGILIRGVENTLDGVEVQQRAFGHGIYMQDDADKTVIKNSLVEGVLRKTKELYDETDPQDLPKRSNYTMPLEGNRPIPKESAHSLCEDGIRMYDIPGSVTIENCTVTKMRGGIRLYLGGPAIVKNCKVTYCEYTNYNLPSNAQLEGSSGGFSFGPLSDYRLGRSKTKAEWTILRSPHVIGDHNIIDIQGNGHHIVLNRERGPMDRKEKRMIVVTGRGSTIINNTEYTISLGAKAKDNKISSYGPVVGNVKANKVTKIRTLR